MAAAIDVVITAVSNERKQKITVALPMNAKKFTNVYRKAEGPQHGVFLEYPSKVDFSAARTTQGAQHIGFRKTVIISRN